MPGFEEEAFARAQQLHHARPKSPVTERRVPNEHTEPPKPKPEPKPEPPKPKKPPKEGILEVFFKDKERSIIMTLLLLLMDEQTDPGLLLALVYLLG